MRAEKGFSAVMSPSHKKSQFFVTTLVLAAVIALGFAEKGLRSNDTIQYDDEEEPKMPSPNETVWYPVNVEKHERAGHYHNLINLSTRQNRSKRSIRSRLIDYDDDNNFNVHRRRFSHNPVKWRISKYSSRFGTNSEVDSIVRRAFATWSGAANVDFSEAYSWDTADIDLQFMDTSYDTVCGRSAGYEALAHQVGTARVGLHFFGNNDWSTSSYGSGYDVFAVVLHEIGHALGIRHSEYPNAIMYKTYRDDQRWSNDDVRAVQELYGARQGTRRGLLCKSGSFYCGHELSALSYTNTLSNRLYECDDDNDGRYYAECHTCVGGSNINSYCSCWPGHNYCGYELKMMNFVFSGIDDHSLYRCDRTNHVTQILTCSHKCQNNNNGLSSCDYFGSTTCAIGVKYCGYELANRKYTGWKKNVLYECTSSGADYVRACFSGCQEASGDSYCNVGKMATPQGRSYG